MFNCDKINPPTCLYVSIPRSTSCCLVCNSHPGENSFPTRSVFSEKKKKVFASVCRSCRLALIELALIWPNDCATAVCVPNQNNNKRRELSLCVWGEVSKVQQHLENSAFSMLSFGFSNCTPRE